MSTCCPYCDKEIGKEITRKIRCKNCGNTIYVRQGNPVTEREKEILDWQRYMEFMVPDINEIRLSVEKDLTKGFGKQPSSHDLIWGMFNYISARLRKPSDLGILYGNMATFLDSEGKPDRATQLKKQAFKMKVLNLREGGWIKGIKIRNKEDDFVCDVCKKKNNMVVSLEDAYKDPPLPIDGCKNKRCRCWVDFYYENGEEDKASTPSGNDYVVKVEIETPKRKKGLLSKLLDSLK